MRSALASRLVLLVAGAPLLGVAACGGDATTSPADVVPVTATDDACRVGDTELAAGTHVFRVRNEGSRVTEFYVYGSGNRIVGEVENIAPGVSRDLHVTLAAGSYEAACKPGMEGDGIRQTLTVRGQSAPASRPASLQAAGEQYQGYVRGQSAELLTRTRAFVAAVEAGDVAGAKALYPAARLPWERIEPVAESFGDLDPLVDGREGDQEPGQDFTGFHRIEKALWVDGDVSAMGPYADRLLGDVEQIAARAGEVTLEPLQLANGAKALLDEIASGKITGEEERYSHTDLWDLAGNLDGSRAAVDALRPFLAEKDAGLLAQIDDRFSAAAAELDRYRVGEGWQSYDRLGQEQLRALSDRITALTESVSRLPALVAEG